MSTDARNHHYVPQTYLRAFTDGESKKSKFTVFDVATEKRFETVPRNVCAVRDFNRVSIPGMDANAIESGMGIFESLIAPAVAEINLTNTFEGEAKNTILNLMALLAVRHPDRRESMRKFHSQIAKITMGMLLNRREMYDNVTAEMRSEGIISEDSPSYTDVKAFFDGGQYDIEVTNESHLNSEQTMHETALPLLAERSWMLYRVNPKDGHFITSDHPVSITWRNPSNIPPLYRHSPGFGMRDTEVLFPLTKNLVLIGIFDGESGYQIASPLLVAASNSRVANYCSRQIYSSKRSFTALSPQMEIINGPDLLKMHPASR
ncbi:DUF4238 domain-containing protein [Pseudomonas mandelii]|uniref:DUF4238 domain-containing protein n=1 Tax=Pseudomonas mandelii TaxID=75612 RepID=UPI00224B24C4|nr:DUF4238 domain-containing protein [Pseudomonas mandelii]MCX2896777.1 DUF4238 domain-containing protein [Pseudomonas mandelii]